MYKLHSTDPRWSPLMLLLVIFITQESNIVFFSIYFFIFPNYILLSSKFSFHHLFTNFIYFFYFYFILFFNFTILYWFCHILFSFKSQHTFKHFILPFPVKLNAISENSLSSSETMQNKEEILKHFIFFES